MIVREVFCPSFSLWLVGLALAQVSQQNGVGARAERFLLLGGELNLLVGMAGAILGLSTFGLAALRNAVVAAHEQLEYGVEFVLVYGLWFTGVLAIASAPSYAALRVAGAQLRDATFPLQETMIYWRRLKNAITSRREWDST